MRVLITGIAGFAGSHLAEYLLADKPDVEIFGTVRPRSRMDNLNGFAQRLNLLDCDLTDAVSVRKVLQTSDPTYVFHLAAQSYVPFSWDAPHQCIDTNIACQINLFEEARALGQDPVFQIACSSEEYGLVHPDEVPIKETNPLRPLSPYAVSKTSQDFLAYQYHQSYGTKAIRTRGFNHTGPRRGDVFVTSNFAKQVAEIESGKSEPVLKVGNLEAVRDFTDVRDMVRAYWLAVEKAKPGEVYNIASGKGWSIQQLLDMLLDASSSSITVEEDPARLRPSDVPTLIGDASRFREATGWKPEIAFEQTVKDLLEYWRARST